MCKRLRSSSTKDRITDLPNLRLPSDEVSDLLQLPWGSTKRLRRCLPKNMINDLPNQRFPYGEVFDLQWGSTKRMPFCSIEDRISDLPDSILCHILSFLPTNLTVVTSILSKRWKTLYHYVPSYIMYKPFIKSHHLWAALRCRDTEFPIPLFRLFCHRRDVYNPLIMTAIKRGVETLELNILSSPLEMSYLSEILTCKTLTVLKLTSLIIKEPDFPQINVSSIKTLHLNTINFVHTTCMISFFLAFPNLEELQTDDVNHIMGRKVIIPQTKCLLNLVRANTSDIELIPVICFSRALTLNVNKVPLISIVQLPVFYNLTQLELFFTFKQTWHQKWQWILKLLQQSHKLQHLTIHEEIQNETEMNDENWEEPQTVPECLSSQLKTCLFKYYRGTSSELKFAKYVMQNSKVLLSMTIHCSYVVDLKAKYQILQKLSLCLRSCKLIFD